MELREDILGRKVLFRSSRGKRPHMFERPAEKAGICYFCPGNERHTPREIFRHGEPWEYRAFPNKFPILKRPERHDILVETPVHGIDLMDEPETGISMVRGFKQYYRKYGKKGYILFFKNSGPLAGASLPHSHSQMMVLKSAPPEAARRSGRKFISYLKTELESERAVGDYGFCPYASIQPYELWLVPGGKTIMDVEEEFGVVLHRAVKAISKYLGRFSYNIAFFQSGAGSRASFHAQIIPRVNTMAGFEYSSGAIVNTVLPEKAARDLRKALK